MWLRKCVAGNRESCHTLAASVLASRTQAVPRRDEATQLGFSRGSRRSFFRRRSFGRSVVRGRNFRRSVVATFGRDVGTRSGTGRLRSATTASRRTTAIAGRNRCAAGGFRSAAGRLRSAAGGLRSTARAVSTQPSKQATAAAMVVTRTSTSACVVTQAGASPFVVVHNRCTARDMVTVATKQTAAMATESSVSLTLATDQRHTDECEKDRNTESENTIHWNPPNYFTYRSARE